MCEDDVIHSLVFGLIAIPLFSGLVLAAFARRIPPNVARGVMLAATGLATLCALALFPFLNSHALHDAGDLFAIVWLPGTGQMGLHLGDTGLMMALLTSGSLFLTQSKSANQRVGKSPNQQISKSLNLLALSAANVAFLSSNFLGRYVALEVVGLCIALAPLLELSGGMRVTRYVYLALRVGDAGFLAAILLLMRATGTLNIASALDAGEFLLPEQLGWLVAGFVLAVWVKVGAWPLHAWLQAGQSLSPTTRGWLYGIVMPNLGFYLLYRITPLLTASGVLWLVIFWFSVVAMMMALLLAWLQRRNVGSLFTAIGAFLGGLALCCAALGLKAPVWWMAAAFAPLQVLGQFGKRWAVPHFELEKLGESGETGAPKSVEHLPRIAQQVRGIVEVGVLEQLVTDIPQAILNTSRWLYRFVEMGILERLVTDIPQAILYTSRWLYRVVEQGTLEGAVRASARVTLSAGRWSQRRHTGRLRWNLVWVVVAFVMAVIFIVN